MNINIYAGMLAFMSSTEAAQRFDLAFPPDCHNDETADYNLWVVFYGNLHLAHEAFRRYG